MHNGWITMKRFIQETGMKYQTVYKLCNDGTLPASKIQHGKKSIYFINKPEWDEKIKRNRISQL